MKNPNPLMLLRIAQGDAYCMATEYIKFPQHQSVFDKAKQFKEYVKHPVHKLDAGMYTDDTQMSIAVSECLIQREQSPSVESYANFFFEAFVRDKRDGYSRGFQRILEESTSGADLLTKLNPSSTKNGAAMRSVPLGVIPDIKKLQEEAFIQACVTHATNDGIMSSTAIALMSHYALYTDESFSEILKQVSKDLNHSHMCVPTNGNSEKFLLNPWTGPVVNMTATGGRDVGITTVNAVATLLMTKTSLMEILDQVIDWGGDTDSVAAIALGIASCRMKEQLPDFFENGLEVGGKYGPEFLKSLGAKLMEKFSVKD